MSGERRAYMSGFGNEFATESLPGALPVGRNSPQRCPYGLYAEQLSGTAFTALRADNRRSWLYRIRPAAMHTPFERMDNGRIISDFAKEVAPPNQLRWNPLPMPEASADLIEGLVTMAGNGDPAVQSGAGVYLYATNRSMEDRAFYNADGEMLFVPQQGRHRFVTELGVIDAEPQEIVVIPRGVRFRLELPEGPVRGYVCENFGANFRLPDLGPSARTAWPIGAISSPRWLRTKTSTLRMNWSPSLGVSCGRPAWRIRRWTWSPGMATTPPTSTTCAASTR